MNLFSAIYQRRETARKIDLIVTIERIETSEDYSKSKPCLSKEAI
jgi:hypothetical protein